MASAIWLSVVPFWSHGIAKMVAFLLSSRALGAPLSGRARFLALADVFADVAKPFAGTGARVWIAIQIRRTVVLRSVSL